jgi:hypothetical protein
MREAFAHEAVLGMELGRPPGCGSSDHRGAVRALKHEPSCPVAPHHSRADRIGDDVRVRTLFATKPERVHAVRELIDRALSGGQLHGPDGARTRWQLRSSQQGIVSAEEKPRPEAHSQLRWLDHRGEQQHHPGPRVAVRQLKTLLSG